MERCPQESKIVIFERGKWLKRTSAGLFLYIQTLGCVGMQSVLPASLHSSSDVGRPFRRRVGMYKVYYMNLNVV